MKKPVISRVRRLIRNRSLPVLFLTVLLFMMSVGGIAVASSGERKSFLIRMAQR
jgi:hypothetical protein